MQQDPKVLARLQASTPRRIIGVGALCGLGVLLAITAMDARTAAALRFALLGGAGLALLMARFAWVGTASAVELTARGLRDADGTIIAALDNIARVDRGMFAFKPSNGFTLRLHHGGDTRWCPGLWWRSGTRVGVGGMTPVHQSKLVAELLAQLHAEQGRASGGS